MPTGVKIKPTHPQQYGNHIDKEYIIHIQKGSQGEKNHTVFGCWPRPSLENAFVLVSFSHTLNLSISLSMSFRASSSDYTDPENT